MVRVRMKVNENEAHSLILSSLRQRAVSGAQKPTTSLLLHVAPLHSASTMGRKKGGGLPVAKHVSVF
jgi:hypothetical protein